MLRKNFFLFGLLILLAALTTTSVMAQSPVGTAFAYQGRLTFNGTPVNDSCDFQFELWNAETSGSRIGSTQTLNTVTVANGLFTVQLNSGNEFGAGAFNGEARWLGIAVRCPAGSGTYTALTPRMALTSSPYALYSTNADLLDGHQGSYYQQVLGTSGSTITLSNDGGSITAPYAASAGNADTVDTYHVGNASGNVPVSNGTLDATLNADLLDGQHASAFWQLGGNSGTIPGTNFLGTMDNQPLEIRVNNTRVFWLGPNSASPNIIGGYSGNGILDGVLGAFIGGGGQSGLPNRVTDSFSTVGGGYDNLAGGGDYPDSAEVLGATVGGGMGNTASQGGATVSGGWENTASSGSSTVGGGALNIASGHRSVVSGGTSNTASGDHAVVSGGKDNQAGGDYARVGGGQYNVADNAYTTVDGGSNNHADGNVATIGGGDSNNASGMYTTIGGGYSNNASEYSATVGGGKLNISNGEQATVGGGQSNTASGEWATVGGGGANTASGGWAIVGGGDTNTASGNDSTVAGGYSNSASDDYSFVGGGQSNTANAVYATVAGGEGNYTEGKFSFVVGRQAKDYDDGVFLFADSNPFDFYSAGANEFAVRASGGVRFVSAVDGSGNPAAGVTLAPGGGSWSTLSDRNLKANFTPVDNADILAAIASLPISTWNYTAQDASIRHIGPTAQDFYASFGVGEDNTHITTVDADGVALAGIQALYQQNKQLEARIAALGKGADGTPSGLPNSPWIYATLILAGILIGQFLPRRSRKPKGQQE